jgi:ribosomal-protein-alanine N-acetyltransferase
MSPSTPITRTRQPAVEPVRIHIEAPSIRRGREFLDAVRASRSFHRPWTRPPSTPEQLRAYVRRTRKPTHVGHWVCAGDGSLAGVININEIVRGAFCSGYLGYYALAPHQGAGHMTAGLRQVITLAFRDYGLHRLEANIQPENARSIALVMRLGFRREGYSPKYLKIGGRWRDHERWALLAGEWKPPSAGRSRR